MRFQNHRTENISTITIRRKQIDGKPGQSEMLGVWIKPESRNAPHENDERSKTKN